jgi:uncharacterized protein YdaU (DUF1376 family)
MAKKVDIWMPLYVADYLSATSRLTTEQHGAYLLLLMDYWKNGAPPDNDSVLAQITRLSPDAWANARTMLQPFFEVMNGAWVQARVEAEMQKANNNKKINKERGLKGAEARWANKNAPSNALSIVQEYSEVCSANSTSPSPSPSHINNTPLPPKGELFDLFWKAYPKKVGKDAAYKAFAKRKPDEQLVKTMIASVRKQADTEQWKKDGGQFIPHASTWLNEGRWQDETEIGAEQDWRITRKGVEDMAEKLGLGRWNQMCQFDQYRNSVVTEATQRGLT